MISELQDFNTGIKPYFRVYEYLGGIV